MYRTIVAMQFRALWRRIGADEFDLAVAQAAPGIRFTFVGDTPLGTSVTGKDAFRTWFRQLDELLQRLARSSPPHEFLRSAKQGRNAR